MPSHSLAGELWDVLGLENKETPHTQVSSVGNVKTVRLRVSCRLGFSECHEARQAKLQAQVSKPAELSLILRS